MRKKHTSNPNISQHSLKNHYTSTTRDKTMFKVRYLVIDAFSSYNMITGWHAFIQLGATLSALYLFMKYLLLDGQVEVISEINKLP